MFSSPLRLGFFTLLLLFSSIAILAFLHKSKQFFLMQYLGHLRPKFLKNEAGVRFYNFHFYSSVARFIPMKMHVSVSAHKGNIFICQIQITGEILWAKFCGRSWRQNFWVKSVVWVCGKVCSEQSAKVYLLLCSSLNNPPKFDNKLYMHHGPKPKKNHQAARFSPSNIYIYII